MNIECLNTLATQFKTAVETARSDFIDPQMKGFPRGACGPAAIILSQFLYDLGYTGMNYCCGYCGDQSHAWIEMDGLIIDITGDQFQLHPEYFNYSERVYVGPMDDFHRLFRVSQVHPLCGFQDYDEGTKRRYQHDYDAICSHIPVPSDDYHLTPDQVNYIKSQQEKATAIVSDPTSPFYEPNPNHRFTAARVLMRKWERERAK